MRDSSSKKLVILSLLIVLCLFALYKVTKYYNNKDIEPIVKNSTNDISNTNVNVADVNNTNNSEEINLGDTTVGCTKNYSACNSICRIAGAYTACEACKAAQPCVGCPEGSVSYGSSCWKVNCKVTASISNDRKIVAQGSGYTVSATLENCNYSVSISVENGTTSKSSISANSKFSSFLVTAGVCGVESTVTFKSHGVTVGSVSIPVVGEWKSYATCKPDTGGLVTNRADADAKKVNRYYSNWDTNRECYTVEWSRDCKGGSSPPAEEKPACYANASVLSLATDAQWGKKSDVRVANSYLISNAKSEAECKVLPSNPICTPTSKACASSNKDASVCEDNISIPYSDGLSCDGKPIYEINCDNKTNTSFDNNDDGSSTGTTKNIYVGQGFKFGINITTSRTCTAKFNADNWKYTYNLASQKISQANKDKSIASGSVITSLESLIKEQQNIQNKLKTMVTTYNNYNFKGTHNEKGSITVNYKANKKSASSSTEFETIVLEEGNGTYSNKSVVNLNVSGVSNPSNYTWSNSSNPRKVKLILPKVYLDKETGKVAKSGIDGGNKLYVDYNIDPGTYNMNILVSGVGCNSSITNNKCQITVKEQEILYRPIDVSNPFINNKWIPGSNWVNSSFDFRSVIHSDIWSK